MTRPPPPFGPRAGAAAAAASALWSPCRCGRGRRRRRREARWRNWASLPRDVLCIILGRLRRQTDILRCAGLACSSWRRVALEEPLLWRHIDLTDGHPWHQRRPAGWKAMALAAVDRSAGRCQSFVGHVDAEVLVHLANSAPLLRQLSVARWPCIPDVTQIVEKLPRLERLVLWSSALREEILVILPMCKGLEEPVRTKIRSSTINDLLLPHLL